MNIDSSKVPGPDCIPVVILKNFEPELSYVLAELFNMCLKESCFPELQHLIHPRFLTGFGILVFLTNLRLMEF